MPGEPTCTLLDDLEAAAEYTELAAEVSARITRDRRPLGEIVECAARLRAAATRLREALAAYSSSRYKDPTPICKVLERINAGPAAPPSAPGVAPARLPVHLAHQGPDGRYVLQCGAHGLELHVTSVQSQVTCPACATPPTPPTPPTPVPGERANPWGPPTNLADASSPRAPVPGPGSGATMRPGQRCTQTAGHDKGVIRNAPHDYNAAREAMWVSRAWASFNRCPYIQPNPGSGMGPAGIMLSVPAYVEPVEPAPDPTPCAAWCGTCHDTHEHNGEMIYQDSPRRVLATRCFCTPACRDAGRPCHPVGKR